MADAPHELSRPRLDADASASNHLAWFRTWMVLERTMSSWVVTAITLIGFGFTIVLLFDELGRFTGATPPVRPLAPYQFGLLLIGAGVAALVAAGWQYRAVLAYLRQRNFAALAGPVQRPAQRLVYAATILTIFIGVFAFLAVAARAL
jgi:inner membrane protein YidH